MYLQVQSSKLAFLCTVSQPDLQSDQDDHADQAAVNQVECLCSWMAALLRQEPQDQVSEMLQDDAACEAERWPALAGARHYSQDAAL